MRWGKWLRFSIRGLLVAMVAISLPCAWLASHIRQQQVERRFMDQLRHAPPAVAATMPAWSAGTTRNIQLIQLPRPVVPVYT